jgi:hypothetical protein
VVSSVWRPFLLLYRWFLILCSCICPSFLLVAELLGFYWGSPCLYLLLPEYSLLFPVVNFRVLGLILRSLLHFEFILIQGDKHGSSFSFLQADNHFSQQGRGCLFSIIYFSHLCQKLGGYSCVDSHPGPLFCFTGLHVCFCASTMLFLLLLLCSNLKSGIMIPAALLFLLNG